MNQPNSNSRLKIVINLADSDELHRYQRSMINLLSKIDITDCNPEVREDVKSLYRLLSHLMINKTSLLKSTKLLIDLQGEVSPKCLKINCSDYQTLSSTGSDEITDLLKPQTQNDENLQYPNDQTS